MRLTHALSCVLLIREEYTLRGGPKTWQWDQIGPSTITQQNFKLAEVHSDPEHFA
jgi:hypothetical protein